MNEPVIVILAGGRGERFWPLSRKLFPKQLIQLVEGQSLLQASVARIGGMFDHTRLFVVVNQDYYLKVQEQLPMLPPENLIIEPHSRNTAPAIGLVTLILKQRYPDDQAVVFIPSDLYIDQNETYRRFLSTVTEYCSAFENPVIAGTPPTRADPGFGYIQAGKKLGTIDGSDYREILRFKEKPDLKLAEEYLKSGQYLWNAGVFGWRLGVLADGFETHLPLLFKKLRLYLNQSTGDNTEAKELYRQLPSVSFDEGILEPCAGKLVVLVGDYTWSDLGSWNAWAQLWPADDCGNRVKGRHYGIATEECLIYSPGKRVTTLGVSHLVIVETEDVLMVCNRNQVQDVKKLVNRLKDLGELDIL